MSEYTNSLLRTKLFSPVFWGLLLLLVGVFYYASYFRMGLNLGGEGGTVAVVAMRLNEGQRPFIDTFLGYNLMWFFPVAWLFKMTGPDYFVLRFFFFSICLSTGLMGYFLLWRMTRWAWFAFLFALLIVLIPGMQFRNYMGFLVVLNLLLLFESLLFVKPLASRWWRFCLLVLAGLGLGLTYLVRIDLGVFFSVLYGGALFVLALAPGEVLRVAFLRRLGQLLLIYLFAFLFHLPFYADAKERGYADAFLEQYTLWPTLICYNLSLEWNRVWEKISPKAVENTSMVDEVSVEGMVVTAVSEAEPRQDEDAEASVLKRRPLSDVVKYKNFKNQAAILSLYLPLLSAALLVAVGGGLLVFGWLRRDRVGFDEGLWILLMTGGALTLFAQYFFFRPDPPHLSEFMVGFSLAIGASIFILVRRGWLLKFSLARWIGVILFTAVLIFNLVAYAAHCLGRESAGGRFVINGNVKELVASNGVHVFVREKNYPILQGLHDSIVKNSLESDYVICFPYSPTVNFMTNRRSYLWNLYIDDVTVYDSFLDDAIVEIDEKKPRVILVDNRAINRTEFSRFKNWAAKLYRHIKANYRLEGTFGENEIFVLPAESK
ncbi:MAG: hypothetical protein ACK5LK_05970 [Chthoniobacterales bacterium]